MASTALPLLALAGCGVETPIYCLGAQVCGSNANDSLTGTSRGEEIRAIGGSNTINALGGNDVIWGADGNDTINGGSGDDWINAGGGDDIIDPGPGDDVILAGTGDDLVHLSEGEDFEDGGPGINTLGVPATLSAYPRITIDFIVGKYYTTGAPVPIAASFTNFHHLKSFGMVDLLVYTTNSSTIVETAGGNDEIIAGNGNDEITTGGGNDVIDPGSGRDRVFAGPGDDVIYLTLGDKYFDGGGGSDTLRLSASFGTTPIHVDLSRNLYFFPSLAEAEDGFDKRFFAMENVEVLSTGNVTLIGDANANRLTGGGGNDTLIGGVGADVLSGGSGDDTIHAEEDDTIDGGPGNDTVRFAAPVTAAKLSDTDLVNIGRIILETAMAADFSVQTESLNITGSAGADTITGGRGDDFITPGAGADTIVAGRGSDTIDLTETVAATDRVRLTTTDAPDTITGFGHVTDDIIEISIGAIVPVNGNGGSISAGTAVVIQSQVNGSSAPLEIETHILALTTDFASTTEMLSSINGGTVEAASGLADGADILVLWFESTAGVTVLSRVEISVTAVDGQDTAIDDNAANTTLALITGGDLVGILDGGNFAFVA
jgi:Ca2+-binding RTX toxin-like protein